MRATGTESEHPVGKEVPWAPRAATLCATDVPGSIQVPVYLVPSGYLGSIQVPVYLVPLGCPGWTWLSHA